MFPEQSEMPHKGKWLPMNSNWLPVEINHKIFFVMKFIPSKEGGIFHAEVDGDAKEWLLRRIRSHMRR